MTVAASLLLAACAARPATRDPEPLPAVEPVPTEETEQLETLGADATVTGAVALVQPPGYCELLLDNFEETRPLLSGLDASLAAHVERMEALLAEMERPEGEQAALSCPENADSELGTKEIIGSTEWIFMAPPGQHYQARVDSGAETSSMSAREIREYERDGDQWVSFVFQHESTEDAVELELPVVRTVIVRQPGTDEADRRVVVELDIRLGERLQRTEFALTDRSRMSYPVLLGRAFLRDLYVIDVARSYLHPRYEAP